MKRLSGRSVVPVLGLALMSLALYILHRELAKYHIGDVLRELAGIPAKNLLIALFLTGANYLVMSGYDVLGLRYIRRRLNYAKIFFASFVGYSLSQNVGLSFLSGASVRYHVYPAWGLSAEEVTKIVALGSVTFLLGLFTIGGGIFFIDPFVVPASIRLPVALRPLGFMLMASVAFYLSLCAFVKRPLNVRGWQFRLPPPRLALWQVSVSSLDWTLAGGVLFALLPAGHGVPFHVFLGCFLLAQMVGTLSQVPGGLGVFEAAMLLLLTPALPTVSAVGSLLAFRAIYYILPLAISSLMIGIYETLARREALMRATRLFGRWVPQLVPHVLTASVFAVGAALLVTGALPAPKAGLLGLRGLLPLPLLEVSHFSSSVAGMGLMLIARGLQRRLDAAYFLCVALLAAGAVFSLLTAFGHIKAIFLCLVLSVLLPSRRFFYRKASLLSGPFSPGWFFSVLMTLVASIWLGFFARIHVAYAKDLWWQFAFDSDASRFLRAAVGASSLLLAFTLSRLFGPAGRKDVSPDAKVMEKVATIVEASRHTAANLAFLGDKAFLFCESQRAFIMYAVEGRSWIAMGDPVGPVQEHAELLWSFKELSDVHGGWPVVYEAGEENHSLYLDLELSLLKVGEEGRVELGNFSLEGGERKALRHNIHRLEKGGGSFKIIGAPEVPSYLPEFRLISEAWLAEKNTKEKGFSLGFFNEAYLERYPVATVWHEGRVVAFSNMWLGADKEELSFDLMRFSPSAPGGAMDYLLVSLMLWGKHQGYRWFNLGMVPLSGIGVDGNGDPWSRLAAFMYRHGEHFYNFQGLRQYKEKFDPVWRPRYLACPAGLRLPGIIADVVSLISGGLKGALSK